MKRRGRKYREDKLRNYRQQEDVAGSVGGNSFTTWPGGFIRAVSDRSEESRPEDK